ncbi:MAG: YchJ family protein [Halobacteriovoraceae bacterium]|nr:YchJ family protein [Halobacteriovoraceae bacterium]MCB9095347.1 YchJ family protein [Halobacteriovoraceae bacterium]
MKCHCQSGQNFDTCCEPFLNNSKLPSTAEELMRSRYCAYVESNMDYLEQTQTTDGGAFDKEGALKWAKESQWKGLEIISTEKGLAGGKTGIVEFNAHYNNKQGNHTHHEVSQFVFKDKWLFKTAITPSLKPAKRETPKVGRNDPCPCGSGKKYKKCCG